MEGLEKPLFDTVSGGREQMEKVRLLYETNLSIKSFQWSAG